MLFEGFPFIIGWELTLGCNLKCLHCASTAGEKRKNELSIDEAYKICDQLPSLLVKEVVFTGGEPFLCTYWDKLALRLSSYDINVAAVTNGLLISDELTDKILQCKIKGVGISIDGPEIIHDKVRGKPGLFKRTLQSVEKLIKSNIYVSVITSVSGLNIDHLDELFTILCSFGIWQWQLQPVFPRGRSKQNEFLFLENEDFLKLGLFIKNNQYKAKISNLEIVPADSCGYYSKLDLVKYPWKGCSAGISSCGIMSNGKVKGCLSWPDNIVEGDLRENTLWNIWFRENAFKILREKKITNMNGNCKNCEFALQCGGGCQAMSLAVENKWHADPYCYKNIIDNYPEITSKYLYRFSKFKNNVTLLATIALSQLLLFLLSSCQILL